MIRNIIFIPNQLNNAKFNLESLKVIKSKYSKCQREYFRLKILMTLLEMIGDTLSTDY